MPAAVRLLIALLMLPILYLWLIHPRLPRRELSRFTGVCYAHRGLWNISRPENSCAAFTAAAEGGYGIELDVRMTADGALVIHHDGSLSRLCGEDIRIERSSLERVRACRLGDSGEPVPTLAEALTAAGGAPLIVELKNTRHGAQLCQKALELLRKYRGEFCIESFNPYIVRWFRFYAPDIYRGQLVSTFGKMKKELGGITAFVLSNVLLNTAARPQFIAYDKAGRSLSVRLSHLMGADKIVWTMQGTDDTAAMIRKNDAVIFEHWTPDDREQ